VRVWVCGCVCVCVMGGAGHVMARMGRGHGREEACTWRERRVRYT
jgi:hypothetical protein